MRFYFNDLASPHDSRPIVVVAALRLGNAYYPWNIDNSNGYTATAYLDSMQENSTMATVSTLAVSLGPNLQLNVGRRRLLLSGWNELAQSGWKSPATNGTWEADASVEYGGTTFIDVVEGDYIRRISPGILTIIGGIAKAPNSADPVGAILRVNSGWEVNCFGYVRDLKGGISVRGSFENDSMLNFYGDVTIPLNSTITIGTRGAINLYRQSGPCAAFDKALKQVNDKAAFYADTSSAVALSYYDNGGTGLYQADKGSRAFTRKGDLQIGLSAGNDVTFGGGMVVKQDQTVQSNGTMTLGEGSKVRFAGGEHGGYLQLIGSGTTQQLSIGSGVKFSLLDTRRAIPCTFDYWIIRCPAGTKSTALGTLITGLTPGELADRLITENSEPAIIWGDNYYEITHNGNNATTSLLDLGGTAYEAGWQNGEIKLLWSDDSEHPGLFIVGRTPPSSQDSQGQQGGSGSGGENGENEEVALEAAEILRNDPKFRELIKGDKGEPGSAGEDADPYEIAAILASDEEFLSDLAEEIK
jgi:hypothetical protein